MIKAIWYLLKIIIVVFFIFFTPFLIPLMFKLLIYFNLFESINEIKDIFNVLNNKYTLVYLCIGVLILLCYFHKFTDIKNGIVEIFKKIKKATLSWGDKTLSWETAKEEITDANEHKKVLKEFMKENYKIDTGSSIEEMQQLLGLRKNSDSKIKCEECNKKEIQEENIKLRNFAAYNMLNRDAKNILHTIYNEKYIKKDQFKSKIIQGYKNRNRKNIKFTKKDIDRIARNKCDTIYDGLKFLNIIEPSEDDKIITLTKEGKEFVEKYIEKKEVV